MSTQDNLRAAFSGESQANRKYTAFARKADEEGHPQVAKLFRAAAYAETVHALNHLRVLDGVGSTAENLKEAISGETHEYTEMYPTFLAQAQAEDAQGAAISFGGANAVEKIHAGLYQKALDNLGNEESLDYWVCEICGNTVENQPPDICPICQAPREQFTKTN